MQIIFDTWRNNKRQSRLYNNNREQSKSRVLSSVRPGPRSLSHRFSASTVHWYADIRADVNGRYKDAFGDDIPLALQYRTPNVESEFEMRPNTQKTEVPVMLKLNR